MEQEIAEGIVEAVNASQTKNGTPSYGLRIDGVWYNGLGDLPVAKGDRVRVAYVQNEQWKNVKKVDKLPTSEVQKVVSAAASQVFGQSRDASIVRQCLTKAGAEVLAALLSETSPQALTPQAAAEWTAAYVLALEEKLFK